MSQQQPSDTGFATYTQHGASWDLDRVGTHFMCRATKRNLARVGCPTAIAQHTSIGLINDLLSLSLLSKLLVLISLCVLVLHSM